MVSEIELKERLIRAKEVSHLIGLKKGSMYAGMRAGTFPRSVKLGARAVAWRESDVRGWMNSRAATQKHEGAV